MTWCETFDSKLQIIHKSKLCRLCEAQQVCGCEVDAGIAYNVQVKCFVKTWTLEPRRSTRFYQNIDLILHQ